MVVKGLTMTLLIFLSCLLVFIILFCTGKLDWPILSAVDKIQNRSELRGTLAVDSSPGQSVGSFFSTNYQTARSRFVDSARKAGATLSRLTLSKLGPDKQALSVDIAWLGHPKPKRAIIHVSGVHGVEGFAGSAIQLKLLENLPEQPADSAIIFIHALNPYGMAWLRRYNESNVDLNRNFRFKKEDWNEDASLYSKLDRLLNPVDYKLFDSFLAQAGMAINRYGMDALREAIPTGQNYNPLGLFYCGSQIEQGPDLYNIWVQNSLSSLRYLLVIDVHTGLGKRGQESLFHKSSATNSALLSKRLQKQLMTDYETEGAMAYAFKGGHVDAYKQLATQCSIDFITQEFGTYSNLYVLQALRDENREHHFGQTDINSLAKRRLKEAFYPANPEWQAKILEDGASLFVRSAEWVFEQELN